MKTFTKKYGNEINVNVEHLVSTQKSKALKMT